MDWKQCFTFVLSAFARSFFMRTMMPSPWPTNWMFTPLHKLLAGCISPLSPTVFSAYLNNGSQNLGYEIAVHLLGNGQFGCDFAQNQELEPCVELQVCLFAFTNHWTRPLLFFFLKFWAIFSTNPHEKGWTGSSFVSQLSILFASLAKFMFKHFFKQQWSLNGLFLRSLF